MTFSLASLLRGAPEDLSHWLNEPGLRYSGRCGLIILLGFAVYGFTVGIWRAPRMGVFVALKMPCLVFLTLAGNGFLNGILASLLGSGLGFRKSILAQLMSFAIAGLVLGALSPVTFFMALNAPSPEATNASTAHAHFLVTHTFLIALAGILANLHLARLLLVVTPSGSRTAAPTLFAWLSGNAFLGAQLSWILRPFFGTPSIEVAFLRPYPFDGTFYETLWRSLQRITGGHGALLLVPLAVVTLVIFLPVIRELHRPGKSEPVLPPPAS